jgi:hypothetical protein
MKMISTLDKAKPNTGNTKRSDLAAVKLVTVQVTEMSLQQKLNKIGHGLLYKA